MKQSSSHRDTERSGPLVYDELYVRRSHAFHAAKRHSRRVYFLRRVLPIIAGGILLLAILWIWIDPLQYANGIPVEIGALKISGTKLTMEAPKLNGFSKDGHPYSITAETASQDLTNTRVIEFNNVAGIFDLGDSENTKLNAKSGVYDSKTEQLRMFNGININSTRGYSGKLIDAISEPKKGHMISENPVVIVFTDGTLKANRMEIFDQGKLIVFEAGVVMNIQNVEKIDGADDEDELKKAERKKK